MVDPHLYGGQGPLILRVTWSLLGVATLLLALRLFVRLRIVQNGGTWSLSWAFIAWLLGVAGACLATDQVLHGMGNHMDTMREWSKDMSQIVLQFWIFFLIESLSFPLARFSVLAFLSDLQGPTHIGQRRVLITVCIFGLVSTIATVFLIFFSCNPPEKLWTKNKPGRCTESLGRAAADMAILSGAWGTLTDLCLTLYPIYLFSRLNMYPRVKALVIGLMGLGIFSAAASGFLTYQLTQVLVAKDIFWAVGSLHIWMAVELWVILIAGSLPALWPLVQRSVDKIDAPAASGSGWRFSSQAGSVRKPEQASARAEGHPFHKLQSRQNSREPVADAIQVRQDISVSESQRDREIDEEAGLTVLDEGPPPPASAYI